VRPQILLFALILPACADDPGDASVVLPSGYGDGLTGRTFTNAGARHALADLSHVALRLTFDLAAQQYRGHAELQFRPVDTGVPFFLMKPTATAATLDGQPIQLRTTRDPGNLVPLTSIGVELAANSDHTLAVDFPILSPGLTGTGIEFITSMYDGPETFGTASSARYFDRYGPSSIEADQFQMSVDIELVGASMPHQLFSNGSQQATAPGQWSIEFPDSFSTSSFFIQLTGAPYTVRELLYHGLERDIPVIVYALTAEDADTAIANLPALFSDLESTYGPYLHASFTAKIESGGGMEYAGATVTSLKALSHELCHSWFGRGVLPADGRSGWIDEAICTWRDRGYPPALPTPRGPTNLASYSIWYQEAPGVFHLDGSVLLSDIESLLADRGGLRPVLRAFYADWRGKPITTEQFLTYLTTKTGLALDTIFDQYVYGGSPPKMSGSQ
jgi:aminopeptidase N